MTDTARARRLPQAPMRPTLPAIMPADETPGRTINVGQFILEQVRQGVDRFSAAGAAGVEPAELRSWLREGQLVLNRLNNGADWDRAFTAYEQDCADFADKLNRAEGQVRSRLALLSEQIARGGQVKTRRTQKVVDGAVVELVETSETTLPDADMVKWRLERLVPEVYGQRATAILAVVDMTDTPDVASLVEQRFAAIAAQLAPGSEEAAP